MTIIRRVTQTAVAVLAALALIAPANPDTLTVHQVRCFRSVIDSTDILCLARYTISYDTLPTENADDAFVGRFMSSAVEINSSPPTLYPGILSSTTTPPAGGFGMGVMSWYWNAYQTNVSPGVTWEGTGYSARVEGNPSVFTTNVPTPAIHTSIDWQEETQTPQRLAQTILDWAKDLETDWTANDISLQTVIANQPVLTADGSAYFIAAIPNLGLMAPDIFESRTVSPQLADRSISTSTSQGYEEFWVGTALEDGFSAFADLFRVPDILGRTIMLFVIGIVVFVGVYRLSERVEIGFLSFMGVVLPVGTVIGMAPMAFVLTVGLLVVLLLAWKYVYQ